MSQKTKNIVRVCATKDCGYPVVPGAEHCTGCLNARHKARRIGEIDPADFVELALQDILDIATEDSGELLVGEARGILLQRMNEAMTAAWQASYVAHTNRDRMLTCAYCGAEFPPGTPTINHESLTFHGRKCQKNPIAKEREALLAACKAADAIFRSLSEAGPLTEYQAGKMSEHLRAAIAAAEEPA